jgi:hypothetical protein
MRKTSIFTNEPWCFPEDPPRVPAADQTERWCFPGAPPRVPPAGPDDPWCFPDEPPRPRKRGRPRSRPG